MRLRDSDQSGQGTILAAVFFATILSLMTYLYTQSQLAAVASQNYNTALQVQSQAYQLTKAAVGIPDAIATSLAATFLNQANGFAINQGGLGSAFPYVNMDPCIAGNATAACGIDFNNPGLGTWQLNAGLPIGPCKPTVTASGAPSFSFQCDTGFGGYFTLADPGYTTQGVASSMILSGPPTLPGAFLGYSIGGGGGRCTMASSNSAKNSSLTANDPNCVFEPVVNVVRAPSINPNPTQVCNSTTNICTACSAPPCTFKFTINIVTNFNSAATTFQGISDADFANPNGPNYKASACYEISNGAVFSGGHYPNGSTYTVTPVSCPVFDSLFTI